MNKKMIHTLGGILVITSTLFGTLRSTARSTTEPQIGTSWEVMAPLPEKRTGLAAVADGNGHVFAIGGISSYDPTSSTITKTNTNYRYNITTNSWDTVTPIPVPLADIDAAVIDGKIYIPGDLSTSTTYIYDIAADTWSEIPENGGYYARFLYKVVALGTDLYVLGGCCDVEDGFTHTEVWILDTTTGNWSPGIPLSYSGESFAAGVIGDNIYIAGGSRNDDRRTAVEVFDGVSWKQVNGVPSCGDDCFGWHIMADAVGPQGLWLAGGSRGYNGNFFNHAGYYDPEADEWFTSPDIPLLNVERTKPSGDFAEDGYFYAIGGWLYGELTDANERLFIGVPQEGTPPKQIPAYQIFVPIIRK